MQKFAPDKMGKSMVMQGESLFVDLNSFEPGQEHAAHTHSVDKTNVISFSKAVGWSASAKYRRVDAGDAALAPSGIVHSIQNPGADRLVVMAVLARPPR